MGGRQPLCGIDVTSFITVILKPSEYTDLIAVSRPEPGPLILISTCRKPLSIAFLRAKVVAVCAAKGVPFLEPLNPQEPEEDQEITLPFKSETVIIEINGQKLFSLIKLEILE